MQNPANDALHKQDPRNNGGTEDSNLMTIEYLRVRLHSERSVSKAARERADDLTKRVEELEEQLAIVSLQRKRAEKATLDVLAVLENHGVSDISEALYSGSDDDGEGSNSESNNTGKSKLRMEGESEGQELRESSCDAKLNGDGKDELSGSERESTLSTGRSLSWRRRKEIDGSITKKYFESSLRRRTHFVQAGSSSPRQHIGKSCRQIQRKEIRSLVEESRYESTNMGSKDGDVKGSSSYPADCLDSGSEKFKGRSSWNEKTFVDDQVSQTLESQGFEHDYDVEMERALKRQAQLIGQNEAQEKAQTEWEEKYRESTNSTPDSCEPGNQSDVTEERDETRAASSQPAAVAARNTERKCEGALAATSFSKEPSPFSHFNSFKLSPHADLETSQAPKFDEMPDCRAPASDFAFPVINNMQMHHDSSENHILHSHPEPSLQAHPSHSLHGRHTLSYSASPSRASNAEGPEMGRESYALVPREGSQRLERVLDDLQHMKMLLKKECSTLSLPEGGSKGWPVDPSVYARKEQAMLRIPVSSAALSRVPTDFESDYSMGLPHHHYPYLKAPLLRGGQYLPRSMTARPSASAFDQFYNIAAVADQQRVSAREPWSDFHREKSGWGNFAYSSYHEMVPQVRPSNESYEMSSSKFSSRAAGVTPPNGSLYNSDRVRPYMYRY
ncbi:hypothetical protein Dimus_011569 [Dionaea muscipula]